MNNVVVKTEWVISWSENGVGWVQLNHENKLNPLSAGFIVAIKEAAEKIKSVQRFCKGVIWLLTSDTLPTEENSW